MDLGPIENLKIEYSNENEYSRFGILPLLIWYFREVLELERRFKNLTVKTKRKHKSPVKYRKKPYTETKMSIAIIA